MFEAQTADSLADDWAGYEEPHRTGPRVAHIEAVAAPVYTPSHYAPASHRKLIWLVIAAHVAALWAAIHFDVVGHHRPHQPLEVRLVPLDVAPPPKASPLPEKALTKVLTPIVAPPPIVQRPINVPTPVLIAPVPALPQPAAVAAPAAPVTVEAAPIVPPDGFAANLGNTPPSYPIESRRAHEEGTVRLRVMISAQGTVQDVALFKSSGFDRLDDAALRAVRKWRFRPGTQAGTPVSAVGYLSIPFKLTRS